MNRIQGDHHELYLDMVILRCLQMEMSEIETSHRQMDIDLEAWEGGWSAPFKRVRGAGLDQDIVWGSD